MRHRRLIGLAVLVALAALGWGGYAWWQSFKRVATDDAYVEGSIVIISANARRTISGLHVRQRHRDGRRCGRRRCVQMFQQAPMRDMHETETAESIAIKTQSQYAALMSRKIRDFV